MGSAVSLQHMPMHDTAEQEEYTRILNEILRIKLLPAGKLDFPVKILTTLLR